MTDAARNIRVLLVEDEGLVALLLEEMLSELGYEIAAHARCIGEALQLAAEADYGLAILDVNLNGVASFPAAEIVRDRRIPYFRNRIPTVKFSTAIPRRAQRAKAIQ